MMRPLTMNEAMALADGLEVTPDTVASNGITGEVHFTIPNFTVSDAKIYIGVVTGGLPIDPDSIEVADAVLEDEAGVSAMPTVTITLKTEG